MLNAIKRHWETNEMLRAAFPEYIPDPRHLRWSDHCAELPRRKRMTEGTYEAAGVGGSAISKHYDLIIEDDLIYAKKDDLTGAELMPDQDDIEKAIGWHKLAFSLFADPGKSKLDNVGTRWAVHDLKEYIKEKEEHFTHFELSAETDAGSPVWPERFSKEVLDQIRQSQGEYIFATQYLNKPRDPRDAAFDIMNLQYDSSTPDGLRMATIVDLAGWGDTKGKARNVILTGGIDRDFNYHVVKYDRGKFDPSEVIEHMERHSRMYNTKVYVEEIQYQRAIRHFAKKRMEETGEWYTVSKLKYDGRKDAKHTRILNIDNLVSNQCLHVKRNMSELVREMADYHKTKGSSGSTCDILDCIGYLMQVLKRPHEYEIIEEKPSAFSIDEIEKELKSRAKSENQYPIRSHLVPIGVEDDYE